jgi:hypothetical protein
MKKMLTLTKNGGSDNGTILMTLCTDGSWCCGGNNNTNCCDKNLGFRLDAQLVKFETTTSTNTINSTASSNTTCTAKKEDSNTTKVGVGVGVGVAMLGIVGSLAGFWAGMKRGRKQGSSGSGDAIGLFGIGRGRDSSQDVKVPMLPYDNGAHTTQFQDQHAPSNTVYDEHAPRYPGQAVHSPHEISSTPIRAELGPGERRF